MEGMKKEWIQTRNQMDCWYAERRKKKYWKEGRKDGKH